MQFSLNWYRCIEDLFGSDHRPVVLSLTLKQTLPKINDIQTAQNHVSNISIIKQTDVNQFNEEYAQITNNMKLDTQIIKKLDCIMKFQSSKYMNLDLSVV